MPGGKWTEHLVKYAYEVALKYANDPNIPEEKKNIRDTVIFVQKQLAGKGTIISTNSIAKCLINPQAKKNDISDSKSEEQTTKHENNETKASSVNPLQTTIRPAVCTEDPRVSTSPSKTCRLKVLESKKSKDTLSPTKKPDVQGTEVTSASGSKKNLIHCTINEETSEVTVQKVFGESNKNNVIEKGSFVEVNSLMTSTDSSLKGQKKPKRENEISGNKRRCTRSTPLKDTNSGIYVATNTIQGDKVPKTIATSEKQGEEFLNKKVKLKRTSTSVSSQSSTKKQKHCSPDTSNHQGCGNDSQQYNINTLPTTTIETDHSRPELTKSISSTICDQAGGKKPMETRAECQITSQSDDSSCIKIKSDGANVQPSLQETNQRVSENPYNVEQPKSVEIKKELKTLNRISVKRAAYMKERKKKYQRKKRTLLAKQKLLHGPHGYNSKMRPLYPPTPLIQPPIFWQHPIVRPRFPQFPYPVSYSRWYQPPPMRQWAPVRPHWDLRQSAYSEPKLFERSYIGKAEEPVQNASSSDPRVKKEERVSADECPEMPLSSELAPDNPPGSAGPSVIEPASSPSPPIIKDAELANPCPSTETEPNILFTATNDGSETISASQPENVPSGDCEFFSSLGLMCPSSPPLSSSMVYPDTPRSSKQATSPTGEERNLPINEELPAEVVEKLNSIVAEKTEKVEERILQRFEDFQKFIVETLKLKPPQNKQ